MTTPKNPILKDITKNQLEIRERLAKCLELLQDIRTPSNKDWAITPENVLDFNGLLEDANACFGIGRRLLSMAYSSLWDIAETKSKVEEAKKEATNAVNTSTS